MKAVVAAASIAVLASVTSQPAAAQLIPVDPDCEFFVEINILNQFVPAAQACAGAFAGNDVHYQEEIAQLIVDEGWGSASDEPTYLGSTDAGETDGPFSSVSDGPNGTIVFDSPLTGSFIFVLKSAKKFSLYYFESLAAATELSYTTLGTSLNDQDDPQGLSHVGLWSVPEPGAGLLLATAMLGLFGIARRRRLLVA